MRSQSTALTVGRWVGAIVFALLTAVSIPSIAAANWMKSTILDTDTFVELLSPLSSNVQFQNFLATSAAQQASKVIDENLPLGTLDTLASGLSSLLDSLPLNLNLGTSLDSPSTALNEEIASIVQQQTLTFVQGPNFPPLWDAAVRETHGQLVALLSDATPSTADTAVLNINVAPLIDALRTSLVDEGQWWAQYVPTVDVSVPVVEITNVSQLQRYYSLMQSSGQWLVWTTVGLGFVALALAPKRLLMLGIGALATFVSSAYLWRNIPSFGSNNFEVLVEGAGVPLSTQVWLYLSDPLTIAIQGVAGAAVIVAIIALVAALVTYVVTGRRKKTLGA